MTNAYPPETVARADRAEWLLAALRRCDPADADLQASAMVGAALKMLQETRGTPAVLDMLSRIGPLLGMEGGAPAPAPVVTITPEAHAEQLYAIVTARPDAEARSQVEAMMAAGAAVLIDREGVDKAVAALGRLTDRVRAMKPAPQPAPAVVPEPARPADPVGDAVAYLRTLPPEVAKAHARDAILAAHAFLGEVGAAPVVVVPGPAPERAPVPMPETLACAMVDQLRTMPRWDAHERARAVVAGSAAYLHEVFGKSYASAMLAGVLDAATAYGDEVRGGRDSLDTVH